MRRRKITVSAGFILTVAALYFFDDSGMLLCAIPAIAAHELGHAAALRLLGARPTALRADAAGLYLDYRGGLTAAGEMTAALAGPAAGLLFAVGLARLGKQAGNEYLTCAAGISLVLTVFNLLPALPLDGGRLLYFAAYGLFGRKAAMTAVRLTGIAISTVMLAAGLFVYGRGFGLAIIPAGLWLLYFQLANTCKSGRAVVK